jgi:hypothetical protein
VAIDLCMYVLPRQLSVKRHKKLVYSFKGKRIIVIVLEMTGERVYMSNTNCNSKDIFVEVRIKKLHDSLLLYICHAS